MIRVFNINTIIKCGYPSEFDLKKTIPFTMELTHIKTTFRHEEGCLYLSITNPDICVGVDIGVLQEIRFKNRIEAGTEISVLGIYTGKYPRDMMHEFPVELSIAFIGEEQ